MNCTVCNHSLEDHHYAGYVCEVIVNDTEFPYCDCIHRRGKTWCKDNNVPENPLSIR